MLGDFPFTGTGMGTFNDLASILYAFWETHNPSAHNLYLQVSLDLGFPGLIAYLSMLMSTLWMAASTIRTLGQREDAELRLLAIGALAGIVALMVHGLVDVAGWGTRAAFIPWLLIGWIAALYRHVTTNGVLRAVDQLDVLETPTTIQPSAYNADRERQET
jgi:O-antigen ligase